MQKKIEEITINTSPEVLKGKYSNAIKVAVTDAEVILDFALITPQSDNKKEGELVSRVIVNHNFAQKIANSISQTLSTHLKKQQKK